MINQQKKIALGGQNLDDFHKFIAPDDYVRGLNIINGTSTQRKGTVVQNTLGNRKVNFTLPTGNNKVIGFFEDKTSGSGIYLVFNDAENHSVLRYYPSTGNIVSVCQESLLNFQSDKPVASINLTDELFSWTTDDGNPQREFNIERMQRQDENGVFKPVEMNVYFDLSNQFVNGNQYLIEYTDLNGVPTTVPFYASPTEDLETGVRNFVAAFNTNSALIGTFVAESCGTFVEVKALLGGIYRVDFLVTNPDPLVDPKIKRVFTNIYPQTQDGYTFLETFINADKNPPQCEPSLTIKTDTSEKNNFIVSKIFQIRTQYFYVDGQGSDLALSPISSVSIGLGNYIEVNFTDTRLNDENLTIIKGVGIYVKEGELGKWKFIKELGREEIGIGTNIFKFFNDKEYSVISDSLAVKLFDTIPVGSGAEVVADNRKMYGDNVEGYDRVCVETNFTTTFKPPPTLYTVKGIIVIRPLFLGSNLRNAAIFNNGTYGIAGVFGIGQNIPLNGFTVYAAATDFYGVSKQVATWSTHQNQNTGVYDYSSQSLFDIQSLNTSPRDAFKSGNPFNLGVDVADGYEVRDQNGNYVGDKWFGQATNNSSLIFSTFEVNGLPEGEYIFRIAGVETTADDLSSTGYQKTSGYTIAVGSASTYYVPALPIGFEYKMKVGANEISYTNSNGSVTAQQAGNIIYMGCSAMADLSRSSNPFVQAATSVTTGYICDSDLPATPTTYVGILQDTRIERSLIAFNKPALTPSDCIHTSGVQPNWSQRAWIVNSAVTDHNGFFYYVSTNNIKINSVLVGQNFSLYTILYAQAFKEDDSAINPSTAFSQYNRIAIRNGSIFVREKRKTFIKGRVLDGTSPQLDVPVINANGSWTRTDQLGIYQIPCYADTFYSVFTNSQVQPNDPLRLTQIVFSNKNTNIVYNFAADSIPASFFSLRIGTNILSYNNTSSAFWFIIPDNQADLLEEFLGISGWKRGLAEEIAVIYYDRQNRQTTVNDHIRRVYVPFYTENQTVGSAIISWAITSLPPDWATHYQFVRTHSVPIFLQFNITGVEYVDANDNLAPDFTSAAFLKLKLTSLLDYQARYPNTSIGYTFERGDRMRPISNSGGNLYGTYLDAEIVKDATIASDYFIYVEKNNTLLTLDTGTLIEIYTPKPASNILFYEYSECYEIGNPHQSNRFHKAGFNGQDQDPSNPITIPATGTFKTGNVYYRFRNFVLGGAKYIEDSSVSDFYESFTTQTGRPQILDKNAKQVHREGLIRFSNQFFTGTATNGFASFEALNQNEAIEISFGAIRIMSLMSQSVLLVICANKTQTFYVNKATINIPSNTPNLIALADKVLNTADTLIGEWGISDKLSFTSYNNNAWWWDSSKGAIVRYSSNGLEAPSRYKMQSYFADKGRTGGFARAGYDPYHNLYNISIADETVAFNDAVEGGKNLWASFYSYLPECYGRLGTQLLSFLNGELWVHDDLINRNRFYGVQYNSEILLTANDAPSEVKSWQAIALEATDGWGTELTIAPNVTRPLGQRTVIPKEQFVKKEGVLYASFQRDINTVNMASADEALINGDKMRGEVAEVKLVNDNTGDIEIFACDLITIYSPLSNNVRR